MRPAYSAKSVKDYLARDEPGIDIAFGGKGFEHLGVDPEDMTLLKFNKLIDNKHPENGNRLTPRNQDGRIVGWYATLSPPKDVTLLAELSPFAETVRECLRRAGDYVVEKYLEPEATVRQRQGVHGDKPTGNLMWVRLHHTLDRPQDGRIMPQHHLHYFIPNATFDQDRGRFFAAKIRGGWWESATIKRNFHKRLRQELEKHLGVKTRGFGMNWRIQGIDRELVDKFSLRGKAAKANLEKGVPRSFSALVGREDKVKLSEQNVNDLKAQWEGMLTERDKKCLHSVVQARWRGVVARPIRRHFEFIRNLMPRQTPDPRKEMDFDITR